MIRGEFPECVENGSKSLSANESELINVGIRFAILSIAHIYVTLTDLHLRGGPMQNSQTQNKEAGKQSGKQKMQMKDADLVNIILEDHKPLKELVEVMKDSEVSAEERFNAFQEFAPILISHSKPEEDVLYTFMKKNKELREEGFEGEVEHQIADQLVEEIKRTSDNDLRSARIKVLAELVEHHIEEEEEELLPDFKKNSKPEERMQMGNRFLQMKVDYLAAGDDNIIPDPKSNKENRH